MLKAEQAIYDFWVFCDLIKLKGGTRNFVNVHQELASFLARPQYLNHQMGQRRLVMLSRGLAKSTMCIAYVLWRIYRNPNIRVLLGNNSKRLGRAFIRELRQYLENPHLQKTVWDVRPHIRGALVPALNTKSRAERAKSLQELGYDDSYITEAVDTKVIWSMEAIQVIRQENLKEPTVQLVSLGALVTGEHYDLVILDDVVDMQNSQSEGKADTVIEWTRDLESVLDPSRPYKIKFPTTSSKVVEDWVGEEIITVGTPYYSHDLYAYLEANAEDMGLEVFKRNIYVNNEDDSQGYTWPQRLGEDVVERRRRRLNDARLFASQYLLKVTDKAGTGFTIPEHKYFSDYELLDDGQIRIILPNKETRDIVPNLVLDPAATTKETSDYSVLVIGGYDAKGELFILEARHYRESISKVIAEIIRLHKEYALRFARVEAVGGFAAIPGILREHCVEKGVRLGIIPFAPTGRKEDRIHYQLEPIFTNDAIYFHSKLAVNKELQQQLKHFPAYAHDDYPDALASLAQQSVKRKSSVEKHRQHYQINSKYGGCR